MADNSGRCLAGSGPAVLAAGVLTIAINIGLTPLIDIGAPYSETAASSVFLWRQCLSAFAAMLLLYGSIGLHIRQAPYSGGYGAFAFVFALAGTALLLATEWSQVFFVHDLAIRAPDALQSVEDAKGMTLSDLGAMIAFSVFTLGWIAFAISMLRARVYTRPGPITLIVGFFAVPILSAALPAFWGAMLGNAVLGTGWILLGREFRGREF